MNGFKHRGVGELRAKDFNIVVLIGIEIRVCWEFSFETLLIEDIKMDAVTNI